MSTLITAAFALPCAPLAVFVYRLRSRRADERAAAEAFALEHEFRVIVKGMQ